MPHLPPLFLDILKGASLAKSGSTPVIDRSLRSTAPVRDSVGDERPESKEEKAKKKKETSTLDSPYDTSEISKGAKRGVRLRIHTATGAIVKAVSGQGGGSDVEEEKDMEKSLGISRNLLGPNHPRHSRKMEVQEVSSIRKRSTISNLPTVVVRRADGRTQRYHIKSNLPKGDGATLEQQKNSADGGVAENVLGDGGVIPGRAMGEKQIAESWVRPGQSVADFSTEKAKKKAKTLAARKREVTERLLASSRPKKVKIKRAKKKHISKSQSGEESGPATTTEESSFGGVKPSDIATKEPLEVWPLVGNAISSHYVQHVRPHSAPLDTTGFFNMAQEPYNQNLYGNLMPTLAKKTVELNPSPHWKPSSDGESLLWHVAHAMANKESLEQALHPSLIDTDDAKEWLSATGMIAKNPRSSARIALNHGHPPEATAKILVDAGHSHTEAIEHLLDAMRDK